MRRTGMENIRQVLLLRHDAGLSYRMIGAALGVSRGTISNILTAASAAGISWPLPTDADDAWLREVLFSRPSGPSPSKWLRLDVEGAVSALSPVEGRRSPRVTRWLVWERYCAEAAEAGLAAYSYGHFCKVLAKATEGTGRLEMRFPYAPGDWMFSDFSGKSVPVLGPGGAWYPEIIVVVLAYSNLLYVEALEAQSGKHWTMAQRRALEYFGGCSRCLGIDNLKAGVTRNQGEDILLNPSFREFSLHYSIAALPARVRKPADKAKVEAGVAVVNTRILAPLLGRRLFSVEELNVAIGPLLEKLNGSRMRRYGKSRRALFEEQERAALRALPAEPYVWGTWLKRSLGNDYHVQLDYNFYSAPCRYSGQEVGVRVGERMVEIFLLDRSRRIAAHPLQRGRNQYVTEPGHMPENHRKTRKLRDRDYGNWLLEEARKIGPAAVAWTERNFASADFPEQRYRTVRGMLGLADRHPPERVDGACRRGLAVARLGSGFLRAWLKENPEDRAAGEAGTAEPIPPHCNLRGPEYYRRPEQGGDR